MKRNQLMLFGAVAVVALFIFGVVQLPSSIGYPILSCDTFETGSGGYADCKANNDVNFCKKRATDSFYGLICDYYADGSCDEYRSGPTLCPNIYVESICYYSYNPGYPNCYQNWPINSQWVCPCSISTEDTVCKANTMAQCDALYEGSYQAYYTQAPSLPTEQPLLPQVSPTVMPTATMIPSPTTLPNGSPTVTMVPPAPTVQIPQIPSDVLQSIPIVNTVPKKDQGLGFMLLLGVAGLLALLYFKKI